MKILWKLVLLSAFLLAAGSVSGIALDSEESQFLTLINNYRNGSPDCFDKAWRSWPPGSSKTLAASGELATAAAGHNQVMISQNCFDHICPGEGDLGQRANAAGHTEWGWLAENIAIGSDSATVMFNGWKSSSGHNRNMLACKAKAIGIDRMNGTVQGVQWAWTTFHSDSLEDAGSEPPPPPPTTHPYDTNGNCLLDNPEFFRAVDDWIDGKLNNFDFFEMVDQWIQEANICL